MSEMAFRPRGGKRHVVLNITPLIDVMFLLLIFFMLTGTFKRAGELELKLPDSSSAAPSSEGATAHQVELVLLEDGSLLFDGEPLDPARLKGRLEAVLAADPDSRVMLKAEAAAKHGDVIRMLDIVRESGFQGIGIGTQIQNIMGQSQ